MRLGALMTSVFVLGVYYACAFVTFHCGEEPQWTLLDCVYFATVLCSTVGYGDLAPTTPATRALTVVLAIVGIGVVFGIVAGAIETHIIEPLVRPMRRQLARSYPPTVIEVSGLDGRSTAVTVPTKAVYFYAFSLAPAFTSSALRSFALLTALHVPVVSPCAQARVASGTAASAINQDKDERQARFLLTAPLRRSQRECRRRWRHGR